MNSLVSISIPTLVGIDIFSSKVIKDAMFYIQTLRDSGITIDIEYKSCNTLEGDGDFVKEQFDIDTLIGLLSINNIGDSISYFNTLYNGEFNSTKFKIFDMIEKSYLDKYGFSVREGPLFQKYHELYTKIAITEKSLSEMKTKFDRLSQSKIIQLRLGSIMDECGKFIFSPCQNENIVIEKLNHILNQYKIVMDDQLNRGSKVFKKEINIEEKKAMTIKKNKYGQFVYDKYNFVFDPKDKCIIGVSNGIGGVNPLNEENINICEKIGINYKKS